MGRGAEAGGRGGGGAASASHARDRRDDSARQAVREARTSTAIRHLHHKHKSSEELPEHFLDENELYLVGATQNIYSYSMRARVHRQVEMESNPPPPSEL